MNGFANLAADVVSDLSVLYETSAPEMRPSSEGRKSVKWHRLDYYEIAPLTEGEHVKGVLSRGGLMRRTAKRLRSENPAVQLAAIHRCANDFSFMMEGPCLRPLLEAIRDLAGHGRPATPSMPSKPVSPAPKPPPGSAPAHGARPQSRVSRDPHGYGANLVVAVRAVNAFMSGVPMEIPDGVLEKAGESRLDGQAPDDHVDAHHKLGGRPGSPGGHKGAGDPTAASTGAAAAVAAVVEPVVAEAPALKKAASEKEPPAALAKKASVANAATEEARRGSVVPDAVIAEAAEGGEGDMEEGGKDDNGSVSTKGDADLVPKEPPLLLEDTEEEKAARKVMLKRAKLVVKEMQRKKTAFESTDLLLLIMSPLCAVSDAGLWLFDALTHALRDLDEFGSDLSTAFYAQSQAQSLEASNALAASLSRPLTPKGGGGGGGDEDDEEADGEKTPTNALSPGGGNLASQASRALSVAGARSAVTGMRSGVTKGERSMTPSRAAEAAKGALLRLLTQRGNPAAALASMLPRIKGWRGAAAEALERRAFVEAKMADINAACAKAEAEAAKATAAATAVRKRAKEAEGTKKRKKPLPAELADELADAEMQEDERAAVLAEAQQQVDAALAELADLGTGDGPVSHKNDVMIPLDQLDAMVARALRVVHFLWDQVGDHCLLQLVEVTPKTVPALLELLLEPLFSDAARLLFHALTRSTDVPSGTSCVVLSGGSDPVIQLLESQIAKCEAMNAASHSEDPSHLLVLIEVVEIITAMASCDKASLASNPAALRLYPAIPCLSHMLDLDLAYVDAVTLNTAVFAALSALGLRSAEGRLQVCEQGAMQLLVKFVVASADPEAAPVAVSPVLALKERNLRRTADKALLHLIYGAIDTVDAKVLAGKTPYVPAAVIVGGLSSEFDNGRRRMCRLVATLSTEPSNAKALGVAAVGALTASVAKWREVLQEIEDAEEERVRASEREDAAGAKYAAAAAAAGRGLPTASLGMNAVTSKGKKELEKVATLNEDEEEDEDEEEAGDGKGAAPDPNAGFSGTILGEEDITEVDGLGEVMYALQALGQITRLGGKQAAIAVGSDELVEMLVEMLFECGRADGSEVDHRLCVVTDLTWDFEPPMGEDLSVEFRVLRAEAVNVLTSLAHIPATAPRVATHAGLALKMVAAAYGCFAPGLREGIQLKPLPGQAATLDMVAAWKVVLDPRNGRARKPKAAGKGTGDDEDEAPKTKTSPQLMLALLRLIEKLATAPGGREGLYAAALKACKGEDGNMKRGGARKKMAAAKGASSADGKPSAPAPVAYSSSSSSLLVFTAPSPLAAIGDLIADTVPLPLLEAAAAESAPGGKPAAGSSSKGDSSKGVSYSLKDSRGDSKVWKEEKAPIKEALPSFAFFRPSSLVLMGVVGAISGGTMDVEQLQSALRTFRALCKDEEGPAPKDPAAVAAEAAAEAAEAAAVAAAEAAKKKLVPRSSIAPGEAEQEAAQETAAADGAGGVPATGQPKTGDSTASSTASSRGPGSPAGPGEQFFGKKGGVPVPDGAQTVLADTFSAVAVRLGALVSLVLLPQTIPVVSGAWDVVAEASDLAFFLVNRGLAREQHWLAQPVPRPKEKAPPAEVAVEAAEGAALEAVNVEPTIDEVDGGVAAAANAAVKATAAGEMVDGKKPSPRKSPRDDESPSVKNPSKTPKGQPDKKSWVQTYGVPDPNKGPTAKQWAPLLNTMAWVQPWEQQASAGQDVVAPARDNKLALAAASGSGAYWSALLAAVGSSPSWAPQTLTLAVNPSGGYDKKATGGSVSVVLHASPKHRPPPKPLKSKANKAAVTAATGSKAGKAAAAVEAAAKAAESEAHAAAAAAFDPSNPTFEVEVTVLQAFGLPNLDMMDKLNTFVRLVAGSQILASTKVVASSLSPTFNERLTFDLQASEAAKLRVEVWDFDLQNPRLMCSCSSVPLVLPGWNEGRVAAPALLSDAASQAEAMVEALLAGGASPDLADLDGRTALMHALALANDAATGAILACGSASMNARDSAGQTVLQYAFACPRADQAKRARREIMAPPASPAASNVGPSATADAAAAAAAAVALWASKPLVLDGDLRMVAAVLGAGADPNEADDVAGDFGLHWALHGTELAFQLPTGPAGRPRALLLRVHPDEQGSLRAASACVSSGEADVDACNKAGETALHLVVSEGHGAECLELLLGRGADPNLQDARGEIPAHRFARHVVSEAPRMMGRLLEASRGKILRRAVFSNERRGLTNDAKVDLEVHALFRSAAKDLKCPDAVKNATTSVDDILACPNAEGWSLVHCLCGAALYEAATAAGALGTAFDTVALLRASGDETSFAPMLEAALAQGLAQGGAKQKKDFWAHPSSGATPAHLVCRVFDPAVALPMLAMLFKAGADPNALAELAPHALLGGPKGLTGRASKQGAGTGIVGSPLSLAVSHKHAEPTAVALLARGLVHPCPPGASPSPLHIACACGADPKTVRALLDAPGGSAALAMLLLGSEGAAQQQAQSSGGKAPKPQLTPGLSGSPLHAAAAVGFVDPADGSAVVVDLLLKRSALRGSSGGRLLDVGALDAAGRTALHVAALCGCEAAAAALLACAVAQDACRPEAKFAECEDDGVVMAKDASGKTALHLAIDSGSSGLVAALVSGHSGFAALVTAGRGAGNFSASAALAVAELDDEENDTEQDPGGGPSETKKGDGDWAPGGLTSMSGPPPANALEYAERVQVASLYPCRLLLDNPFAVEAAGKDGSGSSPNAKAPRKAKSSKSPVSASSIGDESSAAASAQTPGKLLGKKGALSSSSLAPIDASAAGGKAPKHGKHGSKSDAGAGSMKVRAERDYGAWRRGFRAEFALLSSPSAARLDDTLRFLLRAASGLSGDVPFPARPSPARPLGWDAGRLAAEAEMAASPAASPAKDGKPKTPLSPGDGVRAMASEVTVDSWDPSEAGGMFAKGLPSGAATPVESDKAATAAAAAQAAAEAAARAAEVEGLWSESLGYVRHVDEAFGRGSTCLAERWSGLGHTAATIIQATMRRVLGSAKVKKLKERLRQRRMTKANSMRGSRAPSAMSSRGSSRAGSARQGEGSRSPSRQGKGQAGGQGKGSVKGGGSFLGRGAKGEGKGGRG